MLVFQLTTVFRRGDKHAGVGASHLDKMISLVKHFVIDNILIKVSLSILYKSTLDDTKAEVE